MTPALLTGRECLNFISSLFSQSHTIYSSRNGSVDTHKTRRSRRSRSKSRDRHGSKYDKGDNDRRRRSRSHGRSDRNHRERDRRSRSRDRPRRDRDRRREHDDEPRHRDKDRNGRDGRDKDIDRDERERKERRRKRADDLDDPKAKRLREDPVDAPLTPMSASSYHKDDSRRPRSRDSDRRSVRSGRGPRDDFEDTKRPPPRRERARDNRKERDDRIIPQPDSPLDDDGDLLMDTRRSVTAPPIK